MTRAFTSATCRPALPESITTAYPVQRFLMGGGLPQVVVVAGGDDRQWKPMDSLKTIVE